MLGSGPKETSASAMIFVADRLGRAGLGALRHEDVLRSACRFAVGEKT